MPTKLNVRPVKFRAVIKWLRAQGATAEQPMKIDKIGNRTTKSYYLAWPFGGAILLKAHPKAKVQSEYILTIEQWREYEEFYSNLTPEERNRAEVYAKQRIIKNYTFYPVIPCITIKYKER